MVLSRLMRGLLEQVEEEEEAAPTPDIDRRIHRKQGEPPLRPNGLQPEAFAPSGEDAAGSPVEAPLLRLARMPHYDPIAHSLEERADHRYWRESCASEEDTASTSARDSGRPSEAPETPASPGLLLEDNQESVEHAETVLWTRTVTGCTLEHQDQRRAAEVHQDAAQPVLEP